MATTKWIGAVTLGCLMAGSAMAQYVVSAKSGLVHYTEGQVFLGEAISPKPGEYPEIKEGQHLTTKTGRAEVLLQPGVFLRLAEDTDIKMVSNRLTDTKIEVVAGSVILEVGEVSKENSVELLVAGKALEIRKAGVFRVNMDNPPLVRVYDGELSVIDASGPIKVKNGKQILLSSVPAVEKFAKDDSDAFLRWVGRRSGYMAMANISAANHMRENNIHWNGGTWFYNTMFGMYTFIPLNGRYRNYWDYSYYSPRSTIVFQPAAPPSIMNQDGFSAMNSSVRGMSDSSGRSYSGNSSGSAPTYQAPASSAPAPAPVAAGEGRGAASGGSRGGTSSR